MSLHLPPSEREDKTFVQCHMVHKDRKHIGFACIVACVVGKNPKTPKLNPMLTMPLHGTVYKVWDLQCISVGWHYLEVVLSVN